MASPPDSAVSSGSSPWQTWLLAGPAFGRWRRNSAVGLWIGLLAPWQRASLVLRWGDAVGALLVCLTFWAAPFVSTTLIGLLLLAGGGFWGVLTLADSTAWGTARRVGSPAGAIGPPAFTPIHLLVLLYWSVATVATAFSPVRSAALSGWVKLTLYLLFFALMARTLRSPRLRHAIVGTYVLTALWVAAYGIRQWFFGADALATWVDAESALAGTTRVYSYLGNPNLLAGYLVPAAALSAAAIFAWSRWLVKAMAATAFVVICACLALTFSRGGWIGLVAAGAVGLLLLAHWWSVRLPKRWRRWAVPVLLGAGAAGLAVLVAAVEPLRLRVASIFAGREDSSNNFRLNVWGAVLDMIRDRPWLGIGPGNDAFNQVYPVYQRAKFSALSAYSVPLEVAVEAGLVGLASFLWLLAATAYQGWTQLQRLRAEWNPEGYWLVGALAGLAGMLGHGLVDTVLYRPQVNMAWWLTFAIVASFYRPAGPAIAEGAGAAEIPETAS